MDIAGEYLEEALQNHVNTQTHGLTGRLVMLTTLEREQAALAAQEAELQAQIASPEQPDVTTANTDSSAPAPAAPPPPEETQSSIDALKAEVERLQQAQRVLRGKYDAEVPQLHAQLKSTQQELEQAKAKPPVPQKDIRDMTDAEFKASFGLNDADMSLGRDVLEAQARIASRFRINNPVVTDLQRNVDELRAQILEQTSRNFYDEIARSVPDWRTVNESTVFLDWLDAHPAENRLLQLAERERDVATTVGCFVRFRNAKPVLVPPAPSTMPKTAPPAVPVGTPSSVQTDRTYTVSELDTMLQNAARDQTMPAVKKQEVVDFVTEIERSGRVRLG